MAKKSPGDPITDVVQLTEQGVECYILGTTPLIMNSMHAKAIRQLLLPSGRKTAIERLTSLKHHPVEEFRASVHQTTDPASPTALVMPSTAFKRAICTAALDLPGLRKAQVGRLTYIVGTTVSIFGSPMLHMGWVRSADIQKTPDVRTRAILPRWCAVLRVQYIRPMMSGQMVVNLVSAAGLTVGVGDYRPEKGASNFGQFRVTGPDDPAFADLVATAGREAQLAALESPVPFDDFSREHLTWFEEEVERRQKRGVA